MILSLPRKLLGYAIHGISSRALALALIIHHKLLFHMCKWLIEDTKTPCPICEVLDDATPN